MWMLYRTQLLIDVVIGVDVNQLTIDLVLDDGSEGQNKCLMQTARVLPIPRFACHRHSTHMYTLSNYMWPTSRAAN